MINIPWRGVASLLLLAALIVGCLVIHPLRDALSAAAHGHLGQLRHQLRAGGVAGPLLLVGDHDSYWDTVATGIAGMARRQIRALAKQIFTSRLNRNRCFTGS